MIEVKANPIILKFAGLKEIPDESVSGSNFVQRLRQRRNQMQAGLTPRVRDCLNNDTLLVGQLYLGSIELVSLVTGINQGHTEIPINWLVSGLRIAPNQNGVLDNLQKDEYHKLRRLIPTPIRLSDVAYRLGEVANWSVEAYGRANDLNFPLEHANRGLLEHAGIHLLAMAELAAGQIWVQPERFVERLRRVESHCGEEGGRSAYRHLVQDYMTRGILS